MSALRLLAMLAIALHLSLMLLQVTHAYDGPSPGPVRAFADHYRLITSANRNFRFFAPAVSDNWHVRLLLTDKHGATRAASLPASSRELVIRQHTMMDHFFRDQVAMDRYARGWAAHSFAQDEHVRSVTVIIEQNISPSLHAFRAGERMRRKELMRATYVR
jgi:hypothetical protein